MVTKVAHARLVKVGTVNHNITVWHNACSMASISVSDRIDDVNMNGHTCFDGAALISAYVAKTYHSSCRCAGVTKVVYSFVLSGCSREYCPKCMYTSIHKSTRCV